MGRAKALLWDNDGILVDTEPLYMGVTREIMAEVGVGLSIDEFREVSLERGQSCFELVRAAGFEQQRNPHCCPDDFMILQDLPCGDGPFG